MSLFNFEEYMKFKVLLIFMSIFITNIEHATEQDLRDFPAIILTNPKLKIIDGSSWGMNALQYKKTLKLRMEVNMRLFGEKTSKGLIGYYTYDNKRVSIETLASYEQSVMPNQVELKYLHTFLKTKLIEDFIQLTSPFLQDATGAKQEMMELIKEWAHKAKRDNSHLLAWGASKEGEETIVVRTKINTIKEFEQFCSDLVYFLETLMRSCKIATEQYKELFKIEQQQALLAKK